MQDRNMPLWLETRMTELLTDDAGRVCGARIERQGVSSTVRARAASILR